MRIGAASIKFRHDGAISGRSVSIGVRLASNVSGFVSGVTLHAKVKRVPERERERGQMIVNMVRRKHAE